ncbi:RNA-binding protein [Phreatobacter sp.]|uniref:RNA-binding protein n=1 Tax=Phreatobacter sp. TaxID=1966341 RepID=UPI003F6E6F55
MVADDDTADLALDGGPNVRRGASERTCIVGRKAGDPSGLIRFVVDPSGRVIPDLKARLPGRGAWVTARRAVVAEAVRRKLFARAFRREVVVDGDLTGQVERLVEAQALAALSMANKAGAVVTGFAKVEAAIGSSELAAVVHAADAGDDGVRKLGQALSRSLGPDAAAMPRIAMFTSSQLDLALGRLNVIHAALLAGGPSANVLARCTALEVFRSGDEAGGTPLASVNEPKHRIFKDQPTGAGPEPND